MIALGNGQALEGSATSATTVTITVSGLTTSTATPPVALIYELGDASDQWYGLMPSGWGSEKSAFTAVQALTGA